MNVCVCTHTCTCTQRHASPDLNKGLSLHGEKEAKPESGLHMVVYTGNTVGVGLLGCEVRASEGRPAGEATLLARPVCQAKAQGPGPSSCCAAGSWSLTTTQVKRNKPRGARRASEVTPWKGTKSTLAAGGIVL